MPPQPRRGTAGANGASQAIVDALRDYGKVARSLYETGKYDAMVIDLHMPIADGFGLIEHVRKTPAGKLLPIVVISGSNSGKGETRSLALGATSFLAKPVTTDELVQELYRALEA